MFKKRLAIFFLLMLSFCLTVRAQDNPEIANQLLQVADEIYSSTQAYIQARDAYIQVLDFDPDNLKANFMAGYLYIQTINKERAISYFTKVYEIDPEYSFDLTFWLGRAYQFGLDFDNAIQYYNQYLELYESEPDYAGADKIPREVVEKHIRESETAKILVDNALNYNITNVGPNINSEWPDYGPSVNRDETVIVFTTRRQQGNTNADVFEDNFPYEEIFISYKGDDGEWTPAENISSAINTPYFDSNLAISDDGRELYLYRDDNNGDIYISRKQPDDTWSYPEPLPGEINSSYKETSVTISPDGNTIFFASDRPGGMGGLDIYFSTKGRRGIWSAGKNLGETVNTSVDDDFPFLDYDGKTLYFSSEGHTGMGGFDIYKTVYDSTRNVWIKPVNIGYSVNSPDNDISYITTLGGKKGYYSSVKEDGYGYQDIYEFNVPDEVKNVTEENPEIERQPADIEEEPVIAEKKPIKIILYVQDQEGDPIDGNVQLRNSKEKYLVSLNRETKGRYVARIRNQEPAAFTMSAERDDYMFYNESVTIPAMTEDEQLFEYTLVLRKLKKGSWTVLRNVYFDFDKATLKDESYLEINKLYQMLSENSRFIAEIAGHTDNIGSKRYNQQLSYQRAKAVVDVLIQKGIDPIRIQPVGYGEERPLASNDDEKEGRELNRRVEFRVMRYIY